MTLKLPRVHPQMNAATIYAIHAQQGSELKLGSKLLDCSVDLTASVAHDCPPVTNYRLTIREQVWLRRLDVAIGDTPEAECQIGLFSTTPDEPLDGAVVRSIRVAVAGIVRTMDW